MAHYHLWRRIGGGIIGDGLTKAPGMRSPQYYYTPSIAPSDMIFYSGKLFEVWKGNIFIGAMAKKHLNRVDVSGSRVVEEERLRPPP